MKIAFKFLILGAIVLAGYLLYNKLTKPEGQTGSSGNQGTSSGGMTTGQSSGSGLGSTTGSGSSGPSTGTGTGSGSFSGYSGSTNTGLGQVPCSFGERQTGEFLKKQLSDNREMVAYYENQIRQIMEMPLCSTGRANVLGCVNDESERQKLLEGARRQRDYFAGLAAQNEATLNRLPQNCL